MSQSFTFSVKLKFMMDILLAIRNNNMTKIPNYDPSYGEHLLKISKSFVHKGNYISELKISMDDLLNGRKFEIFSFTFLLKHCTPFKLTFLCHNYSRRKRKMVDCRICMVKCGKKFSRI